MHGMLSAEGAVLVEFQLFGGIPFVLVGVVVALFALGTPKRDLYTVTGLRHIAAPPSFFLPGQTKNAGPGLNTDPSASQWAKYTHRSYGGVGFCCLPMTPQGERVFALVP